MIGGKRKTIGVFINKSDGYFDDTLFHALQDYAKPLNLDLLIFYTVGYRNSINYYDTHECNMFDLAPIEKLDGIIAVPDSYEMLDFRSRLNAMLQRATCPIVNIRYHEGENDCVFTDENKAIRPLLRHLIHDHGLTKVAFLAGYPGHPDSELRLQSYREEMEANGLPIPEGGIFYGTMWYADSDLAYQHFFSDPEKVPEAIVCANDYMALGLMEELESRGVRIPEDIAISGFDETVEGAASSVALTTVAIPIVQMATKAVDTIEDLIGGAAITSDIELKGTIIPKCSCGCCTEKTKTDFTAIINRWTEEYVSVRRSTQFMTDIQNQITEIDKLKFINGYNDPFQLKRMYLCLCMDDREDDKPYSDTMLLKTIFPFDEARMRNPIIDHPFPRKDTLPEGYYDSSKPLCHVVFPVHYKNTTFGYLVSEWSDKDITIFIAPYGEGIAYAYNDLALQAQFSELVDIKRQNLIDPLTGISNRRGFEQSISDLMLKEYSSDTYISFLSVDLDNLKTINDTYGHAEGDVAIVSVAQVLSEVVTENNTCARVGGDEFYAIVCSEGSDQKEEIRKRFYELLEEKNKEINKEYTLHASVGIHTVAIGYMDRAFEHLQMADRLMYEAKRKYKEQL